MTGRCTTRWPGAAEGRACRHCGYASADLLLAARARGITPTRRCRPIAPAGPLGSSTPPLPSTGRTNGCARRRRVQFLDPGPPQGPASSSPSYQGDLRTMPGPGPVHHRGPLRPPARLAPPPGPRGPHRRPRRAGRRQRQAGSRRGGGHLAQATRHRHPPRPLPRPGQTRLEHNTAAATVSLLRLVPGGKQAMDRTRTTTCMAGPRSMKPENMTTNCNRVRNGSQSLFIGSILL
jgi:hypothetical protein